MKRKLLNHKSLKQAALAVPAAALMLGASQAAQVGINFQDNYAGNPYAPLTAASAFGIPLASWYNAPSVYNSYENNPFTTNGTFALPGGGSLRAVWGARNTWSIYAAIPAGGDDQVVYGYLDDWDPGYTVTLSGFRGFASSFTVTTIASSDGATGFQDANVYSKSETNTVQYLNNFPLTFGTGLAGTSTVSSAFVTLNGNDSITIRSVPKNGDVRGCLAGIIIDYTPSTANPPLIEVNPQTPAGILFPGSSFVLSAQASGAPTLHYQWRKDTVEIPGATYANYTNSSAVVGDTGGYDVVVTNANGTATSTIAQVTIQNLTTPTITKAPLSQSLYAGYPATFAVEATGGSLTYEWKKGSTVIAGATTSSYTIPSIATTNQDTYTVTVSNPVGNTQASATLTVKVAAPGSYEAALASSKPSLWFRTSETGSVNQDTAANSGSIGAAGTGLYIGATTHPVNGALVASADKAATLGGGRISVPYNATLNPSGPFTVECWINPASGSGTGAIIQSMINGENPNNANDRNGWALRQNSGGLRFLVGTDLGAPFYYYYTTASGITAGVWQHVAVVYDGTAPSIYINGVLTPYTVTRQDGVAITQPEIDLIRIVPNTAAPLIMGDRGYGGWAWSGSLDEVAVYPTALTPAQLQAHYQNGTNANPASAYNTLITADGAAEYLRLNDTVNLSLAANSGTLGAAWNGAYQDAGSTLGSPQIARGIVGPRPPGQPGLESTNVAFVMTNGFVSAPVCNALDGNHVTITGWIKPEDIPSAGDLGWPCWLGQGGMHIENTSGRPTRELRYHWTGSEHWGWSSGLVAPANVWTFVALVIEPDKATIYMSDGTTLKSSVNNVAHTAVSMSSPVGFGGNQPGSAGRTYRGALDEMAVYNRSLTSSEITTLFMIGTGAKLELQLSNGGIIEDTKPLGTPHHGVNTSVSTAWVASSTDVNNPPVTRTGVAQFTAATPSQITVAADPDFDSAVGTIAFWMRVPAVSLPGPGNEGSIIFDRRTSNGTVIVLNDDGSIFVQCAGGANTFKAFYVVDDLWHHVAVTYDQSASGFVGIYIDGISFGTSLNLAAWSWPTTQQIELGRSHDGYWKRFDGQLDDFRIYNRVLNDTEIASIKASDALVDTSALKLRYNFNNTGIGKTVSWPFGTLESSPVLGPGALWTPVPGATAPNYPFLPTDPQRYYRATP